jgi:hypothetical protein
MKKHLFYTFLLIFAVTAAITVLGLVHAIDIADGYLKVLVAAFLIESAAALVAVFRGAEFFKDEDRADKEALDRLKQGHVEALERLQKRTDVAENEVKRLYTENQDISKNFQAEITRLDQQNQALTDRLQKTDSLRLQILAVLGSMSTDRANILRELHIVPNSPDATLAVSVIGKLVADKEIEVDPGRPIGYYRLRKE